MPRPRHSALRLPHISETLGARRLVAVCGIELLWRRWSLNFCKHQSPPLACCCISFSSSSRSALSEASRRPRHLNNDRRFNCRPISRRGSAPAENGVGTGVVCALGNSPRTFATPFSPTQRKGSSRRTGYRNLQVFFRKDHLWKSASSLFLSYPSFLSSLLLRRFFPGHSFSLPIG